MVRDVSDVKQFSVRHGTQMDNPRGEVRFISFFVSVILFAMFSWILPLAKVLGDALPPETLFFYTRAFHELANLTPLMLKFPLLAFVAIPIGFLLEQTFYPSKKIASGPNELPPLSAQRIADSIKADSEKKTR